MIDLGSPQYLSLLAPFRRVIPENYEAPPRVVLTKRGTVKTRVDGRRWCRFTATQVRALPFVHLRVIDSYRGGIGDGFVSFGGYPFLRSAGCAEMNSGALHRFLAEAAWYPTAEPPSSSSFASTSRERRRESTLPRAGEPSARTSDRRRDGGALRLLPGGRRPCLPEVGGLWVTVWRGGDYFLPRDEELRRIVWNESLLEATVDRRSILWRPPIPGTPGLGEVLVRHEAIGVNFIDGALRAGKHRFDLRTRSRDPGQKPRRGDDNADYGQRRT